MNKIINLLILLIMIDTATAYTFSYPTPYYYNSFERINKKVNMSFIEQFENFTPEYLKDKLNIEFTARQSANDGYCYCHSFNGRIEITIYRNGWVDYDYWITRYLLERF